MLPVTYIAVAHQVVVAAVHHLGHLAVDHSLLYRVRIDHGRRRLLLPLRTLVLRYTRARLLLRRSRRGGLLVLLNQNDRRLVAVLRHRHGFHRGPATLAPRVRLCPGTAGAGSARVPARAS